MEIQESDEEEGDEDEEDTVSLREGETPDISSHAQRNLEQIRLGEEEGDIPEGRADDREEEMREDAEE